ncbi:uncharacterized protein LOC136076435 [Hydra vulgaris]|uniref:Uncharacterized protein LOC136076435 n=1 Tax=Hydra vulgaris TaxID=6087 RepID=A0ABM4BAG1_HYDVU
MKETPHLPENSTKCSAKKDANKSTIVLYGMSSVGKPHIATKYCEISYNFYKNLVWIVAAFAILQILGFEVHNSKENFFAINDDKNVLVKKVTNFCFDEMNEKEDVSKFIQRRIVKALFPKYFQAIEEIETLLEFHTEVHIKFHIKALFPKYFQAIEEIETLLEFHTEVLSQILDINDPSTKTTKNNTTNCWYSIAYCLDCIAYCLHSMEKFNKALEISYSIDKIRVKILGINHQDTMTVKRNIALCLDGMRKYNEALEIYYFVDKIQTKILGINHPDTIRTKLNIALCLDNMGKYQSCLII